MHKNILIAGVVIAITAGAAIAQTQTQTQTQRPAAPPAAAGDDRGARGGPGGPGFRRGPGFGGPGGFRGGQFRQPPTPQEVQQRNAALVARMDANRDGRVTFEEFRADQERQRTERQRRMFERFSGEKDSFTLDQLNARALERLNDRDGRRGPGAPGGPGARRGGPPAGQAPAAPAAR